MSHESSGQDHSVTISSSNTILGVGIGEKFFERADALFEWIYFENEYITFVQIEDLFCL